jgi:hypothetical protein
MEKEGEKVTAPGIYSMRVVRRVLNRTVQFGGEEHSGWLPLCAAQPLPTPIIDVLLNLEIVIGDGSRYFLQYSSINTSYIGDTWHEDLEGAIEQARVQFGIEPREGEVLLE